MRSLIVDEKKDKEVKLAEAARDVTGIADEQGGLIVYGIEEETRGAFKRAKSIGEG